MSVNCSMFLDYLSSRKDDKVLRRKKAVVNWKQFYEPLQGAHVISSSQYVKGQTEKPELEPKKTHVIKKIKSTS